MPSQKHVVILGGGFGGIRAALDLADQASSDIKITLITDKPHFEYYPTLYRVVTGRSARQMCIPLSEIFKGYAVEVVQDYISEVNLKDKALSSNTGNHYEYDYLILALGSEASYFGIPGIAENSRSFKCLHDAVDLKEHLHSVLMPIAEMPQEQKAIAAHIMVVGGGPTGIEVSADLVAYLHEMAKKHQFDPSFVTVDLIEAAPRLLPAMPPDFSEKVKQRLQECGVNIYLDRAVIEQQPEELILKDMRVKTKTVIWTAGVRPNGLYSKIEGLELDKRGKVVVDEHLRAKGFHEVFAIGDGASTQYSGMAQTADHDGTFVAMSVLAAIRKQALPKYAPKKPIYAIPAGGYWAAVLWGDVRVYGFFAHLLRYAADVRYFLGILPFWKAFLAIGSSEKLAEACPVCSVALHETETAEKPA